MFSQDLRLVGPEQVARNCTLVIVREGKKKLEPFKKC